MPIHLFPVKIGTWNILNYPGPTDFLRENDFRRVLDRLDLDILVIQDMISVQGVSQFLNNVLNYSVPDIIQKLGGSSDNELGGNSHTKIPPGF